MESFGKLKRRGTDLLNNAQMPQMPHMPHMPQMPNMPHMPKMPQMPSYLRMGGGGGNSNSNSGPTMKGTWQHLDLPPLPRSSHSLDVVAGHAYLFGGEVEPGQPLDNDMHVVILPSGSASSDCYAVKARPSPKNQPASISEEDETAAQLQDPLTQVPLGTAADDPDAEPSSASAEKGKEPAGDQVPQARLGHATAVIGTRIFMFGGRGAEGPLDEGGRVWIFETKTQTWTFADPHRTSPAPPPRSGHCATATDKPRDFAIKPLKRRESWKEWAEGDSADVGIPQRPIAGSIAEHATDDEDQGFGTLVVHGGVLADGRLADDVWAFDVRAATWKQLPAAPGPARSGAALTLAKSRLYRFGGADADGHPLSGRLDVLDLILEEFDDRVSRGEIGIFARGGWQTIDAPPSAPPAPPLPAASATAAPLATPPIAPNADEEPPAPGVGPISPTTASSAPLDTPATEADDEKASLVAAPSPTSKPPANPEPWPAPRAHSSMHLVLGAGGREYLVLVMGRAAAPSPDDLAATTSAPADDVWAFQVPPLGMTAASVTDALWHAVGARTGEGRWARVLPHPFDDEVPEDVRGPPARAALAAASVGDMEENALVVFGGVDAQGRPLGDGWVFRLE
ncbi:hypothetical protein F4780DRAFT_747217 [Xylariomycetidae sp. FL0641]|nr:hypothetical protein F4780DRAFT_747217 [Xylariomycetidae sp. FL0641]